MNGKISYERVLRDYLTGELKALNAHLPARQKTLADLFKEEYPQVLCNDGSVHLFKRRELEYIDGLLDGDERSRLLLPILIQISPDRSEVEAFCPGMVEAKVIQKVIGMPLEVKSGRITLYRRQLAVLRRHLKTTTQYVFAPPV